MKKIILTMSCVISLLIANIQSITAETIAVEGNSIFILDNSVTGSQLVVRNLSDGTLNSCLADSGLNLLGLNIDTDATDVIIKKGTAVVTTLNAVSQITDVKLVDVKNCPISYTTDLSECYAAVQGDKLIIPCLKYGDDIISVVLGRRGNSMNYEYESSKPGKDHKQDSEND
ncbi:MAG: hypothetical protein K2P74_08295 [Nitrosomonas sp.]|nr:hypothetical protein [Nitrosomonas sp.]